MYTVFYNGSMFCQSSELQEALNLSVALHKNSNVEHTIRVIVGEKSPKDIAILVRKCNEDD